MNDERPIEKLLRRFAKKRREEAGQPLELHPATRRLLQGEVSRQFPKSDAAGAKPDAPIGWLTALRARWIYVTAAASAVVIAAVWIVTHPTGPTGSELAKQEVAPTQSLAKKPAGELAENFDSPPPILAPTKETGVIAGEAGSATLRTAGEKRKDADAWKATTRVPTIAADTSESKTFASRVASPPAETPARPTGEAYYARKSELTPGSATTTDKLEESVASSRRLNATPSAPAPVVAAAPTSPQPKAPTAQRSRQVPTGSDDRAAARRESAVATSTPATPPPAGAPAAAFESRTFKPIARGGGLERDKQPVLSQSFANLATEQKTAKAVKAAPAAPVLLNFQIEQAGNQLRVIDGDGSTYFGEIAVATAAIGDTKKGAEALKNDGKLLAVPPAQTMAANNFYRVIGTNRTLNQQVVFTWNFIELTNTLSEAQAVGGLLKNQTANTTQQIPTLFNNSGISGRAQINTGKEIEINAVPVNP